MTRTDLDALDSLHEAWVEALRAWREDLAPTSEAQAWAASHEYEARVAYEKATIAAYPAITAELRALRVVAEAARDVAEHGHSFCEATCVTFPSRHARHVGRCAALRSSLVAVPTP